ncbi:MAG TPA: hypothetical protein VGM32_08665 [Rhodopila sp.]
MTNLRDIDATQLDGVLLSADGTRVRLRIRDQNGQTVSLSLPVKWLNSVQNALPRRPCSAEVIALDSWSLDRTPNGRDLVLTLRTPEGQAVSFAIKPWQVEGMATIATYGGATGTTQQTVH